MSTSATSTTHATSNPAITSKDVIEFREANLGMSAWTSARYRDEAGVGTTIRWSNQTAPNSGAARTKSEGNSGNDIIYDITTEGSVTLTINQHMYSAFEIEEFESNLTTIELRKWLARGASYVLDVSIDDTLAALVDNFSQAEGTLAFPITDVEVRRSVQYLDDANAPGEGRCFGMSPATKMTLLGIERYVSSDFGKIGSIARGTFGDVYGLTTWTSTNIEGDNTVGHDNGIWQKDAIAMGMRMKPHVRKFDDISSTNSCGLLPAAAAVLSTLMPCSSTPVRKKTSLPRIR